MRVIKYLVLPQVGLYFVWFHTEFAVVIIKCQTITEQKYFYFDKIWVIKKEEEEKLGRSL